MKGFVYTLLLFAASPQVLAANVPIDNVTVTDTLIDDQYYGGCMAKISPSPSTESGDCGADFVTFACDGTFGTKSTNRIKYDAAVAAYALADSGAKLQVVLDTAKKINGFCYAARVDLKK